MRLGLRCDREYLELRLGEAKSEVALGRQLAEQGMGEVEKFLNSQMVSLDQIREIVVFAGPGSFTSLRIIHSLANALSFALAIPTFSGGGDHWYDSKDQVNIASPDYGRPPRIGN